MRFFLNFGVVLAWVAMVASVEAVPPFSRAARTRAPQSQEQAAEDGQQAQAGGLRSRIAARTGTTGQTGTRNLAANLSPAQQQNVARLQADLGTIKQGSQITPEQKAALKNDLMSMAQGATKPSPQAISKLAGDLSQALASGKLSVTDMSQLSTDLHAVMDSVNLSPAQVQQAQADALAILQASGVGKDDVQVIGADLKAIVGGAKTRLGR